MNNYKFASKTDSLQRSPIRSDRTKKPSTSKWVQFTFSSITCFFFVFFYTWIRSPRNGHCSCNGRTNFHQFFLSCRLRYFCCYTKLTYWHCNIPNLPIHSHMLILSFSVGQRRDVPTNWLENGQMIWLRSQGISTCKWIMAEQTVNYFKKFSPLKTDSQDVTHNKLWVFRTQAYWISIWEVNWSSLFLTVLWLSFSPFHYCFILVISLLLLWIKLHYTLYMHYLQSARPSSYVPWRPIQETGSATTTLDVGECNVCRPNIASIPF